MGKTIHGLFLHIFVVLIVFITSIFPFGYAADVFLPSDSQMNKYDFITFSPSFIIGRLVVRCEVFVFYVVYPPQTQTTRENGERRERQRRSRDSIQIANTNSVDETYRF